MYIGFFNITKGVLQLKYDVLFDKNKNKLESTKVQ